MFAFTLRFQTPSSDTSTTAQTCTVLSHADAGPVSPHNGLYGGGDGLTPTCRRARGPHSQPVFTPPDGRRVHTVSMINPGGHASCVCVSRCRCRSGSSKSFTRPPGIGDTHAAFTTLSL